MEQLHKIFKLCGSPTEDYWRKLKLPPSAAFRPSLPYVRHVAEMFKDLPTNVLSLLEALLSIDPEQRGSAAIALESEVLGFNFMLDTTIFYFCVILILYSYCGPVLQHRAVCL